MLQAPPYTLLRRYWVVYAWMFEKLRTLDALFPGSAVTSWWRNQAENTRVGGAEFSQHRLAFAWDIVPPADELAQFADVAASLGWVVVRYPTHVHLQVFPADTVPKSLFTV